MNYFKEISQFLSWVFHPLTIMTYVLILMLMANPYAFGVSNWSHHQELILVILVNTFFLPGIAVLLFCLVGFSSSLSMKTSRERVGPYIAAGIVYIWMIATLQHQTSLPPLYKTFFLGATISLFLAFFINNFSRVSAHTTGMGGFLGMWLVAMTQGYGGDIYVYFPESQRTVVVFHELILAFVILSAGLVGSARLFLQAHVPGEVYGGYLIGFAGQLLALQFYHLFV